MLFPFASRPFPFCTHLRHLRAITRIDALSIKVIERIASIWRAFGVPVVSSQCQKGAVPPISRGTLSSRGSFPKTGNQS